MRKYVKLVLNIEVFSSFDIAFPILISSQEKNFNLLFDDL